MRILLCGLWLGSAAFAANPSSWNYSSLDDRVRVWAIPSNPPGVEIKLSPPEGYTVRPDLPSVLVANEDTRTYAAKVLGLIRRPSSASSFWVVTEFSVIKLRKFDLRVDPGGVTIYLEPEPVIGETDAYGWVAQAVANRDLELATFKDAARVTYEYFRTRYRGTDAQIVAIPTVMGSIPFERRCADYLGREPTTPR